MFKSRRISSNVWSSFIVRLIITNISVREWGLKEVFCERKYIKDEESGEKRKYSLWWAYIYASYGRLSPCCIFIALPHVHWDLKVFWNLPNLCRQEGCSQSNHIPGEMHDGNAFILQKTISLCTKFIITPLPWIHRQTLPLNRWQGSLTVYRCSSCRKT